MTRNMTTTELTEHKVKELNQLITELEQNCKELVKAEDEIKILEQKVEKLKNERLNLAITELDKDAIIRKAINFYRDLWDVVEDKQIRDLDNCNEMLNGFDSFEFNKIYRIRRTVKD